MDLAPVVERLRQQCPRFRQVGGAAEYGVVADALTAAPAAYVIEESSRAAPNELLGIVRQQVEVAVGVYLAVRDARDGGLADLPALRQEVWAALAGWLPAGAIRPLEYREGVLVSVAPGLIWWREVYAASHELSQ